MKYFLRKTHLKFLLPVVQKYSFNLGCEQYTVPFKHLRLCQFYEFKQILLHRHFRKFFIFLRKYEKTKLILSSRITRMLPRIYLKPRKCYNLLSFQRKMLKQMT